LTKVADEVIGRDEELAALRRFVAQSSEWPAALVVEGEAGAGKTTLWEAGLLLARERGALMLEARPAAAEARLALSGLADLLGPVAADVLDELPPPQAAALRGALAADRLDEGTLGERALFAGVLNALRALARERPVVVAIDDVQWLDASSSAALAYAWRRLRAECIGLLVAFRAGSEADPVLVAGERVAVGPLSMGAIHRLLRMRLGLVPSRPTLRRLHEVTGGNPFFALELGRALQQQPHGSAPDDLPIPTGVLDLVGHRLAGLEHETRRLLGATAAIARPTLSVVSRVGGGADALAPAFRAGVVTLEGDRLRFVHPLLAAAAYDALEPLERRDLHARLAALVEDEEERARHLALASSGPDEDVAAALERAARRAAGRGATPAALELVARSRALTPAGAGDAERRRLRAEAYYAMLAGDPERARTILLTLLEEPLPREERASTLAQLVRLAHHGVDWRAAVAFGREALAWADEPALRAVVEGDLAQTLFLLEEDRETRDHVREMMRFAELAGDEAQLVRGLVFLETAERGFPSGALLERIRALDLPPSFHVGPASGLAYAAARADRYREALARFEDLRRYASDHGDDIVTWALIRMAEVDVLVGDWPAALEHASEAAEIAMQARALANEAFAVAMTASVEAHLGRIDSASASASRTLELATSLGLSAAITVTESVLGFMELSLGDARAAHVRLGPLVERRRRAGVADPSLVRFVPNEIEALVELGLHDEAEAVLAWYEARARALDRPLALASAARCRGLLAAARGETAAALTAFDAALAEHERVEAPFERARTLLAKGSTERRANRRRVARATLDEAAAELERLGAALWLERARDELARIGGRTSSADELTPSERRVAELVVEGRTNREVAAALFVTTRTVETHLSHIYGKLGVRSRTELARRFHPS
jgi:DNA-binding CsgD family transcriptional regulator